MFNINVCLNRAMIRFGARNFHRRRQKKIEKPERPTRPKTKVVKRPAHKKKTTASSDPAPDDDVGNPDLEVELDSLLRHDARFPPRLSPLLICAIPCEVEFSEQFRAWTEAWHSLCSVNRPIIINIDFSRII